MNYKANFQRGFSLIELLVSMAITLVVVLAAAIVYINTRESDAAQSKLTDSLQTGAFATQLLGRDIAQAGTYPVVMPVTTTYFPEGGKIGTQPEGGWSFPPQGWKTEVTNTAFHSAVFGCDGGRFNPATGVCDVSVALAPYRSAPDTLIINYFSADSREMGAIGTRFDCTGSNVGNVTVTVNATRKLNEGASVPLPGLAPLPVTENVELPPHRPLFVSNRYTVVNTNTEVDQQTIATRSLACHGNSNTVNQPLMLGVEDLQVTYGVAPINAGASMQLAPQRFYTAVQVAALPDVAFEGVNYPPWDQVTAVRICMMTRTLGNTRVQDKITEARTYLDCTDETPQTYAATDRSLRKRHVQVFALRNRLTQTY